MASSDPVLVVGAGPTGMTAALELTRFGVPVRIIDKYKKPPDTSRALAVQARTLELFYQRGLADEMVGKGNKAYHATIFTEGKPLGSIDMQGIDSRFCYILLLAQSETERILREHLAASGCQIEKETELVSFAQSGSRDEAGAPVTAVLRKADGTLEEVRASYLIDAEGSHSIVRRSMDMPFEGESLPHTYALADLHLEGDVAEDGLSIFVGDHGLLAAFPMGNGRYRVIATEKDAEPSDAPSPTVEKMQALWNAGAHVAARFHDMVWSSRFRINSRALKQLRHGRIFFGGDSAHVHSPAGGQGMNTGIQDMINLCWKLALVYKGRAGEELLATYDEERLPIIRALVNTTERATDLFNSDSSVVLSLLTHALPIAMRLDAVRRKGAQTISELQGAYRKSPLSTGSKTLHKLAAGDRMPDLPIWEGLGERLLSRLDPTKITLITLAGIQAPFEATSLDAWRDLCVQVDLHEAPGRPFSRAFHDAVGDATLLLVRPDGYLAYAGQQGADVAGWLKRWLC